MDNKDIGREKLRKPEKLSDDAMNDDETVFSSPKAAIVVKATFLTPDIVQYSYSIMHAG